MYVDHCDSLNGKERPGGGFFYWGIGRRTEKVAGIKENEVK